MVVLKVVKNTEDCTVSVLRSERLVADVSESDVLLLASVNGCVWDLHFTEVVLEVQYL